MTIMEPKQEHIYLEDADSSDGKLKGNGHVDSKSPSAVKVDKDGIPLVPQPSDHKDDPLVSRIPIQSQQ